MLLFSLTITMNRDNKKNNTVENLRQKINNEIMKYSEILAIAKLLGYEVVWKKKRKIGIKRR